MVVMEEEEVEVAADMMVLIVGLLEEVSEFRTSLALAKPTFRSPHAIMKLRILI